MLALGQLAAQGPFLGIPGSVGRAGLAGLEVVDHRGPAVVLLGLLVRAIGLETIGVGAHLGVLARHGPRLPCSGQVDRVYRDVSPRYTNSRIKWALAVGDR